MSFPLSIFLIVYSAALLVYLVLSFFSLYHILKFGFMDTTTKCVLALYCIITLGIFIRSGMYIASIDWNESVTLFQLSSIDISL